jgi:1-deoxy-D-xylulose-5-phosphate reductoisomerase
MELAYAAGRAGGTMPAVMNAANEQAVALFLAEQVHFLDIPRLIDGVCDRHKADLSANPSLDDVLAVDAWSRAAVREAAARLSATRRDAPHVQPPAALPA